MVDSTAPLHRPTIHIHTHKKNSPLERIISATPFQKHTHIDRKGVRVFPPWQAHLPAWDKTTHSLTTNEHHSMCAHTLSNRKQPPPLHTHAVWTGTTFLFPQGFHPIETQRKIRIRGWERVTGMSGRNNHLIKNATLFIWGGISLTFSGFSKAKEPLQACIPLLLKHPRA